MPADGIHCPVVARRELGMSHHRQIVTTMDEMRWTRNRRSAGRRLGGCANIGSSDGLGSDRESVSRTSHQVRTAVVDSQEYGNGPTWLRRRKDHSWVIRRSQMTDDPLPNRSPLVIKKTGPQGVCFIGSLAEVD